MTTQGTIMTLVLYLVGLQTAVEKNGIPQRICAVCYKDFGGTDMSNQMFFESATEKQIVIDHLIAYLKLLNLTNEQYSYVKEHGCSDDSIEYVNSMINATNWLMGEISTIVTDIQATNPELGGDTK